MAKPREFRRTLINRRILFLKQKLLKCKQWLLVMGSSLILLVFIDKQNRFCRQSFVLIFKFDNLSLHLSLFKFIDTTALQRKRIRRSEHRLHRMLYLFYKAHGLIFCFQRDTSFLSPKKCILPAGHPEV